jgi:hypothetical protein
MGTPLARWPGSLQRTPRDKLGHTFPVPAPIGAVSFGLATEPRSLDLRPVPAGTAPVFSRERILSFTMLKSIPAFSSGACSNDFGILKWSTSAVCFGPPWAQQTSTLYLSVSLYLEAGVGLESQGGAIRADSSGV